MGASTAIRAGYLHTICYAPTCLYPIRYKCIFHPLPTSSTMETLNMGTIRNINFGTYLVST